MNTYEKFLISVCLVISVALFVFSYGYVDLNLTFSQNHFVLKLIGSLQYFAYYQRPLATYIYVALMVLFFVFFTYNLIQVSKGRISLKYVKIAILVTSSILVFAYPFLSSDLFNYMFDAKIIATYHASPYSNKPLDFAGDEWLRFMRWTHRYSPYGPLWLVLSLIPTLIGLGKFITTLFAFKIFIASFQILNCFLIYKIAKKIVPQYALFALTFYGLNPLFLIEAVVNSHNDVLVATSLLTSIYFFVLGKKVLSYFSLVAGAGVKYIPVLNIPWLITHKKLKFNSKYENLIALNILTMAIFTLIYSNLSITVPFVSKSATQVQFQPWYLLWTLSLVALIPNKILIITSIAIAAGAMARYIPFLYWGDWFHDGTIVFMQVVTLLPAFALVVAYFTHSYIKK